MSKQKSKKDKKSSGHKEAQMLLPKKIAIVENLEPIQYWDDWSDYRDSFRWWYRDRSRFHKITYRYLPYDVIANNKKLKRHEIIRKIRRMKEQ